MIFSRFVDPFPARHRDPTPGVALNAAIILRDCSFRERSASGARRACRELMRGAAIEWRRVMAAGR